MKTGSKTNGTDQNHFMLDTYGYCCLAFVINNSKRERKHLIDKNISTTEIQRLIVNGKTMDIFFAYNHLGDICEFVCPIH